MARISGPTAVGDRWLNVWDAVPDSSWAGAGGRVAHEV